MGKTALRSAAVGTLACLLFFPHPRVATAAHLRDEAVSYRQEGYERQRRGDLDGAISAYQKAIDVDPAYAAPFNDLGVIYEQQGQFDAAEQAYEEAIKIDPEYAAAHSNLALLSERLGHKEKAIVHWLKRYQMGEPRDPWTAHAEQRLIALGVLKSYPGLKSQVFTRRRVLEQELAANEKTLRDFRGMTESREQAQEARRR